jgi:uncharacterized glyoxalase superfamily protein PhnB
VQTIYPFLRYQDAPAAIEWLVRAFGCEKHAVPAGDLASASRLRRTP